MSAAGPTIAIRNGANQRSLPHTISIASLPPVLLKREEPARRARIWEFNTNLHCSIVGTCLSNSELRQVLRKLDLAPPEATDHELHGTAVSLAGRHDIAAKLLNKALDHRHKLAVNQFAKAGSEAEVRAMWRDAVRRGDIPGAYWATLTHPATTRTIISEAFGEVHMLSHLVGAANRADIRRLCQLEAEKSELEAKLERQQDAVVTRDARIRELSEALAQRPASEETANDPGEDTATLRQLVADLERRLAAETRRRTALEDRLTTAQNTLADERSARLKAERECETLRAELHVIEVTLSPVADTAEPTLPARLESMALLYVGGRPNQVCHLRAAAERLGAAFLHHDGGIENHPTLLPGLASRADLVLFPVDCISHEAALAIKSLCQQAGKRFIPLRSASVTAMLAALQRPEVIQLAEAAD